MITKDNLKTLLSSLNFTAKGEVYSKHFEAFDCELKADFRNELLVYPENNGFVINERQTCNFKANENFVVFECVCRLLTQGYNPAHIELEPKWQVGHGASGGRADILIKDNDGKSLLIIECKTAGAEFAKAWNTTQTKPTQLFSYVQQTRTTQFIALYASDFIDGKIASNYYLIALSDNEELLKNNPKLSSYKDSSTVEEIYKVWSETYDKDFATLGLFEDNKPYEIGKTKFTAKDLKNINSKDIQTKYHEFATVLRQHNVSGRENAFDKLVNLFLCKVVDEKENTEELKFYWKGKAYDNPFDFQDRLQQLYKEGMKNFLGEDITYIDNNQIDSYFAHFDLNELKTKMKGVIKELKFFKSNDFAFIDVHNEKLFYQNFEVLLKIARLIQDISLTGSDENQFLGDMFEGFLDQGVKQSEGQFFTPMPIVKFIINALPYKNNPTVIDYACGAGHFLNEYATTNKTAKIIGVEKEYRLSKVAKVSSFMYGSEIEIIYSDALSQSEKIKENSFDVLVANPPYSVKGFLETLSDEERGRYELIQTIDEKSYTANNAIECFFIERAKQLLNKGAVAAIIVPSSILNKGNKNSLYVKTREIVLRFFDIVAIAEFGSGTFGKTGTNTVTLFLQRKCDKENLEGNLQDLATQLFECKLEGANSFKDKDLLLHYCQHIGIDLEVYTSLLCEDLNDALFVHELFKAYKNEFEKLSETKNRRSKPSYKQLNAEQKGEWENKELVKWIKTIEKDKFTYFCLALKNSCDVIIVKSPSDGKENKRFLGYEWSSAKGNEGIHYLSGGVVAIETEQLTDALDEEDLRLLENLTGLKSINTPLYNPRNRDDNSKINKIIKDNFEGIKTTIPEALTPYVSRSKLADMLDFSRVEFNKAISLNVNKKVEIESKYPLTKLGDVCNVLIGGTPSRAINEYFQGDNLWVSISEMNGETIKDTKEKITDIAVQKSNVKLIPAGTTLLSFKLSIGKTAIAGKDLYTNEAIAGLIPTNKKQLLDTYLFQIFSAKLIDLEKGSFNTFGKSLNSGFLKEEVKIPLPPLPIQQKIVDECQAVDNEVNAAKSTINQAKAEIEQHITRVYQANYAIVKLADITSKIGSGATPTGGESSYKESGIILIRSMNVYDDRFNTKGLAFIDEEQAKKLNNVTVEKNDILFNITGASVARCCIVPNQYLPARVNQHVAIIRLQSGALAKYVHAILVGEKAKSVLLHDASGASTREAITKTMLEEFKIPLPQLAEQQAIVTEIEALETKITQAQSIIDNSKTRKEAVLKAHL